jgi:hypothetical protein
MFQPAGHALRNRIVMLSVLLLCARPARSQAEETIFHASVISSGRNRPSMNLKAENLANLLGLLHRRIPYAQIEAQLAISSDELQRKLGLLVTEGLARRAENGIFLPTCVVATNEDARTYFQPDGEAVSSAVDLLQRELPTVRSRLRKVKSFSGVPFKPMSFFIASDVLLDNWQINNVEHLFLNAERPLRTGGHYYFMIFEKRASQLSEPFGIYGNTGSQLGIDLNRTLRQRSL